MSVWLGKRGYQPVKDTMQGVCLYGLGRADINKCRSLCKVCDCMAGEEGISTSEGHYVRCVTIAGEEGISTSEGHYVRCVIVWLGKRGSQPVKDTMYGV